MQAGITGPFFFPDNKGQYVPAPYILTESEIIRFLRLDIISTKGSAKNRLATLARYRRAGLLKGVQIGKSIRYCLPDVVEFTERIKIENSH